MTVPSGPFVSAYADAASAGFVQAVGAHSSANRTAEVPMEYAEMKSPSAGASPADANVIGA
jgi:hypothetical protein